jgi:hypothetical protein
MTEIEPIEPTQVPPVLERPQLEQIAQVASEESEEPLSPNQAAAVIAAYHNVVSGDPVGTMRRDPETGAIALKVLDNGLFIWRVNVPDGTFYNDLQPTLPWPKLD